MKAAALLALLNRAIIKGKRRGFTIITATPNELCAELHDRMPVILSPEVAGVGEPADAAP